MSDSKLYYTITRHYQRYEHLAIKGYVDSKRVLDVGCSFGYGTMLLSNYAEHVIGIDPILGEHDENCRISNGIEMPVKIAGVNPSKVLGTLKFNMYPLKWEAIDYNATKADVVVAIEVIEHLEHPEKFLFAAAKIGKNLFLTTPLAAVTGKTDNEEHVIEYSHDDLLKLVSKDFNVLEESYQTGDMVICGKAEPTGTSMDPNHTVQMLWLESKYNGGSNAIPAQIAV